jgi:predicted RNase H-like HicB family nuclease
MLPDMQLTIEVEREGDGRWIADLPALPGVTVYGESREGAIRACKALALRVLADRLDHGEDILTGHADGTDKDVPQGLTFAVAA